MKEARVKRHRRIRKTIAGTQDRPRLSVFRSLKNLYAQLIDDDTNTTILTCSTQQKELKEKVKSNNINAATLLGELIAKGAKDKGIESVVFDRGGYLYHGKIKAVAEAARKGGLKF